MPAPKIRRGKKYSNFNFQLETEFKDRINNLIKALGIQLADFGREASLRHYRHLMRKPEIKALVEARDRVFGNGEDQQTAREIDALLLSGEAEDAIVE